MYKRELKNVGSGEGSKVPSVSTTGNLRLPEIPTEDQLDQIEKSIRYYVLKLNEEKAFSSSFNVLRTEGAYW